VAISASDGSENQSRDKVGARRGVKADTLMMSRLFRRIGVTLKNVRPAPSARGF
jgi:hypothetical protein